LVGSRFAASAKATTPDPFSLSLFSVNGPEAFRQLFVRDQVPVPPGIEDKIPPQALEKPAISIDALEGSTDDRADAGFRGVEYRKCQVSPQVEPAPAAECLNP
jgi:hypothetical protein